MEIRFSYVFLLGRYSVFWKIPIITAIPFRVHTHWSEELLIALVTSGLGIFKYSRYIVHILQNGGKGVELGGTWETIKMQGGGGVAKGGEGSRNGTTLSTPLTSIFTYGGVDTRVTGFNQYAKQTSKQ